MPTSIDSLQIEINAKAQSANDAIDRLVGKLDRLSTSLGKMNTSNLNGLANGVDMLGRAMQTMNTVKTADFTRLATNLAKLGNMNVSALNSTASSLSHLTRAFNTLGGVSSNAMQVGTLAQNLSKLGSASMQKAVVNIPQLAVALNNLMTTISRSPVVSQNVIQMTNALANLSAQGAKVGSASRSIERGLNRASNSATRATKSYGGLASAIGKFYATYFLLIRAIKGVGKSITSTADYLEAFNYFNVALGKIGSDWSHQFEQYGYDNAEAYSDSFSQRLQKSLSGLSGLKLEIGADGMGILSDSGMANLGMNIKEITQYASQLASVTNSVGQTGEVSLAASSAFTKLAGDISSLFNLDYSSVAKNLQSGLIGQSRALYKYGIDITNATLQTYAYEAGLTKAVSEMTQAEKMQLRMIAILDQSKVSWGDLANTIMSPSNQIRIFKNNLSELSMVFGQLFVPILSKALPILNALTVAFRRLISDIAGFFGIKIDFNSFGKGYSELEEEIDGIGGAFDDATASANKFKTTTLGIDELNINAPQEESGGGSGVGGGGIDLTDEILNATQEYEKAWQEAFDNMELRINEFADKITKALDPIRDMFKNLSLGNFEMAGADLATFFNNLINPEDFGELGQNIGQFLNNALDFGIGFVENFEWDELGESIATGINEFFKTFDGAKLAEGLNAFVDGILEELASLLNGITWEDVFEDAKGFLGELEIDTVTVIIGALIWTYEGKPFTKAVARTIFLGFLDKTFYWSPNIILAGTISYVGDNIKTAIDEQMEEGSGYNIPVELRGKENENLWDYIKHGAAIIKSNLEREFEGFVVRTQIRYEEGEIDLSMPDPFGTEEKLNELGKTISDNFSSLKIGVKDWYTEYTGYFEKAGEDIANWWTNDVSPWFTAEKWQELGQGILDGISTKWSEFKEWWNGTALAEWWEENVSPWFTVEKWSEIAVGIKDGISETWDDTVDDWKTNISDWWDEHVSSWFEKKKWQFEGIKDGLSEAFDAAITSLKGIWNTFAEWLNEALNLRFEGFTKTFEILGKSITVGIPAFNVQLGKLPTFDIPKYATGGFPEDGLFMANRGELVGKFSNGRTAVANNEQIVDGIKYGVREAVSEVLAPYLSDIARNTRETADKDMSVNIGDREIARANNRGQKALGRKLILEV